MKLADLVQSMTAQICTAGGHYSLGHDVCLTHLSLFPRQQ